MMRVANPRSTDPRTIVITGATDGMGKEAARELARRGARLILVSRNRERCEAVTAACIAETGNPRVDYVVADLSTVRDVRRAAAEIRDRLDHIDTLVNNAGGTFPKRRTETAEGLELVFAVQYLARFVLTEELLGLLQRSDDPLVVAIAGGGRFAEDIDLDDLQSERRYGKRLAITKASTLNELLTMEQARRHEGITFCNLGPGLVRTKTMMATPLARVLFGTVGRLFTRSPEAAGMDIAQLASGGHEGGFYGPELERQQPSWAQAHAELGPALWQRTEELLRDLRGATPRREGVAPIAGETSVEPKGPPGPQILGAG